MKNLKDLLKVTLLSFVVFLSLTACVKDVDFDQVDEILLQPTAIIDLVDFTLNADLLEYDPGIPVEVSKEMSFEVVTDDLKESIIGVDLGFEYFNSLPRTFNATIYFLTDRNKVKNKIEFEIPPGSEESPVILDFNQYFEGEELEALNSSTKIKISLEMQPGPGATDGQLQLKSTAAYKFLF